jgi:signal transduction histidine kinase
MTQSFRPLLDRQPGLSVEKGRVSAASRATEEDLASKAEEWTARLAERNASLNAEIDRRRLLEENLRQSLASVNDALAQQRDFVALVSHELRNSLAVIAATADNLRSSAGEGADSIGRRIGKISRTVRRMSSLIENILVGDLLDAEQAGSARAEMFDLNEILHTTKAGLDEVVTRRVTFIHDDETMVKGDRLLLEVAVQNLIENGLKYSAVTASVTVQLSSDRGMAVVKVTDRGIGVAPGDRELIFMKYYRASGHSARGSGLGLYISREIARKNGGDLTLEASDATGSTFCLSLPIATADPHGILAAS